MPVFRRFRLPSAPRLWLLGALALGLVLQPIFASLGELHELQHDPVGSHAIAMPHDHASGEAVEDHGEDADPLHTLIHLAHCCSQSFANFSSLLLLAALLPRETLPLPATQVHAKALSLAPFRPPIAI